jgi:hypothetical protein
VLSRAGRRNSQTRSQTGHITTVIPGDGGRLGRHPQGCHGHPWGQARPLLQAGPGDHVCHEPEASAPAPSVGVVAGVKTVGRLAPRPLGLARLRHGWGARRGGLCRIVLECPASVAARLDDLGGTLPLASHGIERPHTACDGAHVEEGRHRRERRRLLSRLALAEHEAALLGTPGRQPGSRPASPPAPAGDGAGHTRGHRARARECRGAQLGRLAARGTGSCQRGPWPGPLRPRSAAYTQRAPG